MNPSKHEGLCVCVRVCMCVCMGVCGGARGRELWRRARGVCPVLDCEAFKDVLRSLHAVLRAREALEQGE